MEQDKENLSGSTAESYIKPPKRIEVDSSGRRIDEEEDKKKPLLNFILMGAGSIFTSMIIAGFLLGFMLDSLFNTKPIFILTCGVLGFVGGVMKVHQMLNKMDLLDTQKKALHLDDEAHRKLDVLSQKVLKRKQK